MDNNPYSDERAVDVKSIGNMSGIRCCMCFPLETGLKAMAVIAVFDFLYTLGNMFFGLLFYVVGKSSELTVNAETGQLVVGNELVNDFKGKAVDLLKK